MSGDNDPAGGEVKVAVPLVVWGVTKKHRTSRTRSQLMRSSGREVRITRTPEGGHIEDGYRKECGAEWEQGKQWKEGG